MDAPLSVPHPDKRPYPWLVRQDDGLSAVAAGQERYLIYQPFAGMCNQFSCLECAVALARILGRTLVLPRWRPQYGYPWLCNSDAYFDVGALGDLVSCIDLEEFAKQRSGKSSAGVVLCRTHLEYNPTWSDPKGFELYPALQSLLQGLEYFKLVDDEAALHLGFAAAPAPSSAAPAPGSAAGGEASGGEAASELRIALGRPLRGEREVRATWGGVGAEVLALDHAFNVVALPSVLDAGQRAVLHRALRPCARLREKLAGFLARVERPCLAAHVRRTDHWRLAQLMGDARFWPEIEQIAAQIDALRSTRRLRAWLLSTDCDAEAELATLRAVPSLVEAAPLTQGEDAVAVAVLHLWMCAGADFFVGTRGSMYSDFIERFRVAEGKTVDHLFFDNAAKPAAAAAAEPALPTLDAVLARRERAVREEVPRERMRALALAAAGGEARGGAVLSMMCHRLPPELRVKVLAFHPEAAAMPATVCRTPLELFDGFLEQTIGALRTRPLCVAPAGSTGNVALLIEPRCHEHLEYVVRNAAWFLGPAWQLQIFHGSANLAHLRAAFSASELEHVQLVDLGVDNLSPLAHNELMCTHWLWSRAAAERVLIFQTDSLICRKGVEAFQCWDYVGAPWRETDLWCVGKPWLMAAGNGGFSLRSRAKTLECLDGAGYVRGQCEDVFYAENIPKVGGKLATRAEAARFSVESVYAPDPFGFHAAYKWLSSEEMHQLLQAIQYS